MRGPSPRRHQAGTWRGALKPAISTELSYFFLNFFFFLHLCALPFVQIFCWHFAEIPVL